MDKLTTNGPDGITPNKEPPIPKRTDEADNAAVRAYGKALQRFHDFILHGAIPDDLLPFVQAEAPRFSKDGK
jgi:hypothetical protein